MIILIIKKVAPRNGTVKLVFIYIYKIISTKVQNIYILSENFVYLLYKFFSFISKVNSILILRRNMKYR